jgi:hypothetical protein
MGVWLAVSDKLERSDLQSIPSRGTNSPVVSCP